MSNSKKANTPTNNAPTPKKTSTLRAKAIMYTQFFSHMSMTLEDLQSVVEFTIRPVKWALMVHDKDVDDNGNLIEPHVNVMMVFKNARSLNSIAKLLDDKPQYLQVWTGNVNNGFAYLIHDTKGAQDKGKHKYSSIDVIANFNYVALAQKIGVEVEQAKAERAVNTKQLLDMLLAGTITKEDVIKQLSGSQYGRLHRQIDDVDAQRLTNEAAKWRADMMAKGEPITVIWLYGAAGTGKSSLAKKYAKDMGRPFFPSGSGRDPWQNYNGEHIVILDELRPGVIPFEELLRLFDPYGYETEVMGGARFHDKAVAADTFIVTTPYTPSEFYEKSVTDKKTDGIDQLLRRLSVVIKMDDDYIYPVQPLPLVSGDGLSYTYCPIETEDHTFVCDRNPYSAANRTAPRVDPVEVYKAMFAGAANTADEDADNTTA